MGLLTLLLRLPILPMQGFIRIAGLIGEEAVRELHDPARIRRELEEAQRQRAVGGISEDELSQVEYAATSRLVTGRPATPS
jgi:hypothetical protein